MRQARVLAILAVALCSCGVKGAPQPPLKTRPGEVTNVSVWPREDHVLVKWKIPGADELKKRTAPVAFVVEKKIYIAYDDKWSEPVVVATVQGPFEGSEASWQDFDVRKGKYAYRVTAIDEQGRRGIPSTSVVTVWIEPPKAPKITNVVVGDRTASIEWTAPDGGADGYYVYREGPEGYVRTSEFASPTPTFFEGALTNGVQYKYVVRAAKLAGAVLVEGPPSEPVIATPVDQISPMTPTGVDAFPVEGGVSVRWWPNEEVDLKGYFVYRKEAKTFDKITPEPVADAQYLDAGAKTGKVYYYTVSAVDQAGNESPRSEQAKVFVKR